ncbi:MAG: hypothetical protein QOH56_1502 [Pseudonocardiales bacterium]|jgi:hypothetical protein|nr:hypothetical protein [Pseudonocardiales bacterium]
MTNPADPSASNESAEQPSAEPQPPPRPRRGSVRTQDGDTAAAPSPAAVRRRLIAQDARDQKYAEDARRRRNRRNVLIGSGVAIGVVGVAAIVYWSAASSSTTAHCVGANDQPVSASYCDNGSHIGNFFFFGGSQYHYYYGGNVAGGRYAGGSTVAPRNGKISTDSGKTIRRGGFGGRSSSGSS